LAICTYGNPANQIFGVDYLELNRLITENPLEKNVLSWFVSRTLKLLPEPKIIVSYADTKHNHIGYIYQATNWIYTGESLMTEYFENGMKIHSKTIWNKYGTNAMGSPKLTNVTKQKGVPKHRYFFIVAKNKTIRKKLTHEVITRFGNLPYPKGETKRYEINYEPTKQDKLF